MPLPRLYRHAWMDDDVAAFRDQVRRYVEGEIAPHMEAWRRAGQVPRETWRKFGAMGFLLPEMPEEYGGSGVSAAWQLVVQDELTRAEVPPGTGVHSLAAHYVLDYGNAEQKRRWLPKMVSGEHFGAIGMTEPGGGSDLKALRTRARRDGDHYVIDGAKTFITNGATCSLLVLACRTGGEGARGVSLIVLETDNLPGFSVGRRLEKIGMHASDTCELSFDGVRVPVANLLGEAEGNGFAQMMSQLPYERLFIGVPAAAVIERALEVTLEYTRERTAFGQPLAEFQNTRFKLAEVATHRPRRARLRQRRDPALRRRHARQRGRLHGQVVVHRAAVQGGRRVPAAVRRLRLHDRVPDRPHVRRLARAAHLRRLQRGHEGPHRPQAVIASRPDRRAAGPCQPAGFLPSFGFVGSFSGLFGPQTRR